MDNDWVINYKLIKAELKTDDAHINLSTMSIGTEKIFTQKKSNLIVEKQKNLRLWENVM